jgi:hypothetical protein
LLLTPQTLFGLHLSFRYLGYIMGQQKKTAVEILDATNQTARG